MIIDYFVVDAKSEYYTKSLSLRNEVLRVPIGLNLFEENLQDESDQITFIAMSDEQIIGCLVLKQINETDVKFRQMAVMNKYHQLGIGSQLMHNAENFCRMNGIHYIELHARKSVVNFYIKLGYSMIVEEFIEVGIPHYKMFKKL
jgi:predicted GNAT family N-acyltransferase